MLALSLDSLCSTPSRRPQSQRLRLPTSVPAIRPCDLFPVDSSKLHCDAKLPPELDHLCLACVYLVCSSCGPAALSALYHWVPHVENEVDSFYIGMYPEEEVKAITGAIPENARKADEQRTVRCAQQLLARLGVSGK